MLLFEEIQLLPEIFLGISIIRLFICISLILILLSIFFAEENGNGYTLFGFPIIYATMMPWGGNPEDDDPEKNKNKKKNKKKRASEEKSDTQTKKTKK